jgi:hypothetical protein
MNIDDEESGLFTLLAAFFRFDLGDGHLEYFIKPVIEKPTGIDTVHSPENHSWPFICLSNERVLTNFSTQTVWLIEGTYSHKQADKSTHFRGPPRIA